MKKNIVLLLMSFATVALTCEQAKSFSTSEKWRKIRRKAVTKAKKRHDTVTTNTRRAMQILDNIRKLTANRQAPPKRTSQADTALENYVLTTKVARTLSVDDLFPKSSEKHRKSATKMTLDELIELNIYAGLLADLERLYRDLSMQEWQLYSEKLDKADRESYIKNQRNIIALTKVVKARIEALNKQASTRKKTFPWFDKPVFKSEARFDDFIEAYCKAYPKTAQDKSFVKYLKRVESTRRWYRRRLALGDAYAVDAQGVDIRYDKKIQHAFSHYYTKLRYESVFCNHTRAPEFGHKIHWCYRGLQKSYKSSEGTSSHTYSFCKHVKHDRVGIFNFIYRDLTRGMVVNSDRTYDKPRSTRIEYNQASGLICRMHVTGVDKTGINKIWREHFTLSEVEWLAYGRKQIKLNLLPVVSPKIDVKKLIAAKQKLKKLLKNQQAYTYTLSTSIWGIPAKAHQKQFVEFGSLVKRIGYSVAANPEPDENPQKRIFCESYSRLFTQAVSEFYPKVHSLTDYYDALVVLAMNQNKDYEDDQFFHVIEYDKETGLVSRIKLYDKKYNCFIKNVEVGIPDFYKIDRFVTGKIVPLKPIDPKKTTRLTINIYPRVGNRANVSIFSTTIEITGKTPKEIKFKIPYSLEKLDDDNIEFYAISVVGMEQEKPGENFNLAWKTKTIYKVFGSAGKKNLKLEIEPL